MLISMCSLIELLVISYQYLLDFCLFYTSSIAESVFIKYFLFFDPIFDDYFLWTKSQIHVMSYLFFFYPELDLLILIVFSCYYNTNVYLFLLASPSSTLEHPFFVISHIWHC
jgi:hypothetical protein